jgi:hypothetical protein
MWMAFIGFYERHMTYPHTAIFVHVFFFVNHTSADTDVCLYGRKAGRFRAYRKSVFVRESYIWDTTILETGTEVSPNQWSDDDDDRTSA